MVSHRPGLAQYDDGSQVEANTIYDDTDFSTGEKCHERHLTWGLLSTSVIATRVEANISQWTRVATRPGPAQHDDGSNNGVDVIYSITDLSTCEDGREWQLVLGLFSTAE